MVNTQPVIGQWSVSDRSSHSHCDFQWNQFEVINTSLHGHHKVIVTNQIMMMSKGAKLYSSVQGLRVVWPKHKLDADITK